MPLVSRDRLTRRMQGDAFGSVSQRSRFAVGDPGLFGFLGRALKGGLGFVGGAVKAQLGLTSGGSPASTTSMVKAVASGPMVETRGGVTRTRTISNMKGIPQIIIPGLGPLQIGGAGQLGMRRRRHMRVTNVRALRRAIRRVQGFARLAHRTISFTRRVKLRRQRRRRAA